jgi:hypothetical protein
MIVMDFGEGCPCVFALLNNGKAPLFMAYNKVITVTIPQ